MKARLIQKLYNTGCVKKGEFTLKSGKISDIYVDIRTLMGYPELLDNVITEISKSGDQPDLVCGVAMGAINLATLYSNKTGAKQIVVRDNYKDHGLKRKVEGVYRLGDKCVIIEDVMTTGTSIISTYDALKDAGINVIACLCIVDRGDLTTNGIHYDDIIIPVHSMLTLEDIRNHDGSVGLIRNVLTSGLVLANDNTDNPLEMPKSVDAIKVHSDIIYSDIDTIVKSLQNAPCCIIEDRKFVDIGDIVRKQYNKLRLAEYADAVTVVLTPGTESTIMGLIAANEYVEILLVTELTTGGRVEKASDLAIMLAKKYPKNIVGFITPFVHLYKDLVDVLLITTGVNLNVTNDVLRQKYITPEEAISRGCKCIIVGRGIYEAKNPSDAAANYKSAIMKARL